MANPKTLMGANLKILVHFRRAFWGIGDEQGEPSCAIAAACLALAVMASELNSAAPSKSKTNNNKAKLHMGDCTTNSRGRGCFRVFLLTEGWLEDEYSNQPHEK